MNETIFRKKSLERIASPDQLDDYLKVSSPSVWLVLIALILTLIAAGVWCFLGRMPATMETTGIRSETGALIFVPADQGYLVQPGMQARFNLDNTESAIIGQVEEIGEPLPAIQAAEAAGAGWLPLSDEWVCPVTVQLTDAVLQEGAAYDAQIVLDEYRPIDLLFGR